MAFIVASRVRHISALADITPNSNIPQVKSTGKDRKVRFVPTTRISSLSSIKTKPKSKYVHTMEEDKYHKLLNASDPAALLNVDRSSTPDGSSAPPSPNMSKRRDRGRDKSASPRVATPTTPPVAKFGGEQLVAINEHGTTILRIDSPVSPIMFYKGSPLDKELPPKPTLRAQDSPERRGLLDATDASSLKLAHPVLQPEFSDGESPASFKSFKAASSLGTPSTISGEFETGTAVMIEGETMKSVPIMDLGKVKPITAIPVRSSKDGSPVQRVHGLSSMPSNSSLKNRATKYGVGPTIRKFADAHEIIMGLEDSPHPPRTSSLPKAVKSTCQLSVASRLSRPTAASAARAAESKKSILTPGKSSLNSASKASILLSANKSATSNTPSNKPSPSIAATSASLPKSDTSSSFKKASKGFKNRFAEMFSGCRRSAIYSTTGSDNKGYSTIASEEDVVVDSDLNLPMPTQCAKRSSKLVTTYRNSGINQKAGSSDNMRGDKKTLGMGKMSDREQSAREQRSRKRAERRADRATEALGRGAFPDGRITFRGGTRIPRGGDEPPSPPPTRDGPAGHYGEDEAQATAEQLTEEEFDHYLESQLNTAEASLNEAIAAANSGIADEGGMNRITNVIQALGASILASRQALMAGIELRAATTNLIEHTTVRAAFARAAIVEVGLELSI